MVEIGFVEVEVEKRGVVGIEVVVLAVGDVSLTEPGLETVVVIDCCGGARYVI